VQVYALASTQIVGETLDLKDDQATALALFGVMNFIVEQRIAQPRKLQELYNKLPERAKAAITKRDTPRT
jgi:hypothetical protein